MSETATARLMDVIADPSPSPKERVQDELKRLESRGNDRRPWTAQEDALLYEPFNRLIMSQLLGRSTASIQVRTSKLGISSRYGGLRDGQPWTSAEDLVISRRDISTARMAQLLRRSHGAVKMRRHKLGITYRGLGNPLEAAMPHPSGLPEPIAELLERSQFWGVAPHQLVREGEQLAVAEPRAGWDVTQ